MFKLDCRFVMCLAHPTVVQKKKRYVFRKDKMSLFYDMNVFASFSMLHLALHMEHQPDADCKLM